MDEDEEEMVRKVDLELFALYASRGSNFLPETVTPE
jgi:hypothetical protein